MSPILPSTADMSIFRRRWGPGGPPARPARVPACRQPGKGSGGTRTQFLPPGEAGLRFQDRYRRNSLSFVLFRHVQGDRSTSRLNVCPSWRKLVVVRVEMEIAPRLGVDRRRRPTPALSRYTFRGGRRRGPRRAADPQSIYVDQIGWGLTCILATIFIFHIA